MPIRILQRSALGICGTLLGLFVAFALVPRWLPAPPRYPDYQDLMRFDPTRSGGHLVADRNLLAEGEFHRRPVRWITNSKGFRDRREFPLQPTLGTRRILFLGDSFVDGMRTDQERTIGYLVEQQLGRTGANVEVLISGHNNPANAWYYLQEIGLKYRPRLVILGVTLGNDLTWHSYRGSIVPEDDHIHVRLVPPVKEVTRTRLDLLLPDRCYVAPTALDPWFDREMRWRRYLASQSRLFAALPAPRIGYMKSTRRHVYAADAESSLGLFVRLPMVEIEDMHRDFDDVIDGVHRLLDSGGEIAGRPFPLAISGLRGRLEPARAKLFARSEPIRSRSSAAAHSSILSRKGSRLPRFARRVSSR
jgi:hypothetical protein